MSERRNLVQNGSASEGPIAILAATLSSVGTLPVGGLALMCAFGVVTSIAAELEEPLRRREATLK